jgi:hypothetical protein
LLAGNPDIEGLSLALADWVAELWIILEDEKRRQEKPGAKGRL